MHEEFTGDKGVGEVTWIDDQNPMDMPLSMLDTETVEEYYKDKTALYTIYDQRRGY